MKMKKFTVVRTVEQKGTISIPADTPPGKLFEVMAPMIASDQMKWESESARVDISEDKIAAFLGIDEQQ